MILAVWPLPQLPHTHTHTQSTSYQSGTHSAPWTNCFRCLLNVDSFNLHNYLIGGKIISPISQTKKQRHRKGKYTCSLFHHYQVTELGFRARQSGFRSLFSTIKLCCLQRQSRGQQGIGWAMTTEHVKPIDKGIKWLQRRTGTTSPSSNCQAWERSSWTPAWGSSNCGAVWNVTKPGLPLPEVWM